MKDPAHLAKLRAKPCALTLVLVAYHKEEVPWAAFAALVKSCSRPVAGDCFGPIEAHHRTGSGLALKASDHEAFPLCQKHHRDFHDSKGMFRSWTKQEKKDWQSTMVERYRPQKVTQ